MSNFISTLDIVSFILVIVLYIMRYAELVYNYKQEDTMLEYQKSEIKGYGLFLDIIIFTGTLLSTINATNNYIQLLWALLMVLEVVILAFKFTLRFRDTVNLNHHTLKILFAIGATLSIFGTYESLVLFFS